MSHAPGRADNAVSRVVAVATPTPANDPETRTTRREFRILLVAALLLVTANIGAITLPSIDDCFYARKGVEMAQRGAFFTVTWNGVPSFTYPPLQFWLLGLSFRLFGENDAAARLPSALMALAIAWMTWRIGRRVAGSAAGATGAALLFLSPYFLNNARRCMTEIPLAFWVTATFAVLLAGLSRPRLHALLGIPLGAAVLTKSVLGLLPFPVIAIAAPFAPALRGALKRRWIWIGIATGIALGASWTIQQWLVFGPRAPYEHYITGMFAISTRHISWLQRMTGYPWILLRDFEPVVLPALAGAWLAWRTLRGRRDAGSGDAAGTMPEHEQRRAARAIMLAWTVGPLALYALSSTQSARYLFPTLPALSILGGWWAVERVPRVALIVRRFVTPALLALGAVVFWVAPGTLARDTNRPFVTGRSLIEARVPKGEDVAFLGSDYWRYANPLLYYDHRALEPLDDRDTADMIQDARTGRSGLLLVTRDRLDDARALAPDAKAVLQGRNWTLLDVRPAPTPASHPTP